MLYFKKISFGGKSLEAFVVVDTLPFYVACFASVLRDGGGCNA